VVSALVFRRGRLSPVRDLWTTARFTPLVSRPTADELIRVLAYPKFKLTNADINTLLEAYLPFATVVSLTSKVARGPRLPVCRDAHDQMFLHVASVGKADVLVSGDPALLELAGHVPFTIEAPAAFAARFTPEAA
jgi:putative PIN family toxin of toxin-antitoxin system